MSIKYKDLDFKSIKYNENEIKKISYKDNTIFEEDSSSSNIVSRNLWFWLEADNSEITLNESGSVISAKYNDVTYTSGSGGVCSLVDSDTGHGKVFSFAGSTDTSCRLATTSKGDTTKTQMAIILCKMPDAGAVHFSTIKTPTGYTQYIGLNAYNRCVLAFNGIVDVEFLGKTDDGNEDFSDWVILTVATPYETGSYFLDFGAYNTPKRGIIAEALVYSEIPTELELYQISSYLKKKWFNINSKESRYYSKNYNSFSNFRTCTYTPNSIIDDDGVYVKSISDTKYREPFKAIPSSSEKSYLAPSLSEYVPAISYLNRHKVLDFNNVEGRADVSLIENLVNSRTTKPTTFFIVFKVDRNAPSDKIMSVVGSYKFTTSDYLAYDTTLKTVVSKNGIDITAEYVDLYHRDTDAKFEDWTVLVITSENRGYYYPRRTYGVGIIGDIENLIGFAGSIAEIGYVDYGLDRTNRKLLLEGLKEKYNI